MKYTPTQSTLTRTERLKSCNFVITLNCLLHIGRWTGAFDSSCLFLKLLLNKSQQVLDCTSPCVCDHLLVPEHLLLKPLLVFLSPLSYLWIYFEFNNYSGYPLITMALLFTCFTKNYSTKGNDRSDRISNHLGKKSG